MNIPEEFGSYLLLKKLTEDALGETFRAGKVGKGGMEQVVLLRVLNGKGMDGERLWAKVAGRAGVQQALKSPNIGSGVDLGKVRNYPYAAYDYISGKNLAALFAQATKQGSPIPADHAMLIAERISLALAVAAESRVQDERILHGFVVPHLVMVSNEGETRLLGFELAPGLRELAAGGWHGADLESYLSPETLAGQPLSRADDVWSLGAILLELLTGERLAAGPQGYGAAIDAAVLANEGTPLPAPLAALLKKSLVPRAERIADAVTWHKTISKLMIEGQYSPTTFNLAFFMHNLFRDEIDRESQEIQAEKKLAVAPQAAPPAAAVAMPVAAAARQTADMREKTGVREATLPGVGAQAGSAASGGKGLWIGIAAALALAILGGGGWLLFGRKAEKPAPPPAAAAAQPALAAPAPQGTAAAAPAAGPKPEELQAQISAMFDARSKEMEAKLKQQYDDRIKTLQKQLADSKKDAPGDRPSHAAAAAPPLQTEVREARSVRPEPPPTAADNAPVPSAVGAAVPAPAVISQSARPGAVPAGGGAPVNAVATSAPPPAAPVPSPAAPAARLGDLVQPGTGVLAPKMSGMPEPRYPAAARRMNKSADVEIRVLVDELGRVVQTQPVSGKVGFGFDEAAMEAARRSSFRPATKDGVRVKMWTVMRVSFRP